MPLAFHGSSRLLSITLIACLGLAAPALAGPREQAKRMHDRLVGIPPSAGALDSMAAKIVA